MENEKEQGVNLADKKYYWLKLKKDFFKRHDIKIVEDMDNGKDYILFYLKLLCESVDHEGSLRFSDSIPYNEKMLASITSTNIDIVRSAMKVFCELKMIDILDNKTIFMNEVTKMMGSESYWADKKRAQRIGQCPPRVPQVSNLSKQEKELDLRELDLRELELKGQGQEILSDFDKILDSLFEEFYNLYPRKVDKKKASAKYLSYFKKLKTIEQVNELADKINKGLNAYIKEKKGQELKFVAHPTTWLNGERWNDKLEITSKFAFNPDKINDCTY